MKECKYLIIGAGPTGLGAGYRLKELGVTDFIIIEKSDKPGGLATSHVDKQGFVWDVGGHVQFSHYDYFDALMKETINEEGWNTHKRDASIWMQNQFIPYPFQNNIKYINKESMWRCLKGVIEITKRNEKIEPRNFKEWILNNFGTGISELFMLPYNKKVWAYPPEKMGFNWIAERVSQVDLMKMIQDILLDKDDSSWGPNRTFRFPKKGGTGAIWNNVAESVGQDYIQLNSQLVQINHLEKKAILQTGEVIKYDVVLNTSPLNKMVELLNPIVPSLNELAKRLLFSGTNIVGVGLNGKPPESLKNKCWMYFPEEDCPFYRTTVFSNYSKYNVPDPKNQWSLMTETSESPYKKHDHSKLVEETINGLINTKQISSAQNICSTWFYHAAYGYPTPSIDRDDVLNKLIPKLDDMDIYSRGRFGGWKYEVSNQDHSTMQGVEWVNALEQNSPETTYFFPNKVNVQRDKHKS